MCNKVIMCDLPRIKPLDVSVGDELATSGLFLERPTCLDEDDVHYCHTHNCLDKKLFKHKLNVKSDSEFLVNEGKSIALLPLLQDFDPFDISNVKRFPSFKSLYESEHDSKRKTESGSLQLAPSHTVMSASHKELLNSEDQWILEEPLTRSCLRSKRETCVDELWDNLQYNNFNETSLEEISEMLIPEWSCLRQNAITEIDVSRNRLQVSYEELDFPILMEEDDNYIREIIEKMKSNDDDLNSETVNETPNNLRENSSLTQYTTVDSSQRDSLFISHNSNSEIFTEAESCDASSSNLIKYANKNHRSLRDKHSSIDEELSCCLSEKDASNYSNTPASNNKLEEIKRDDIIPQKNVKVKDSQFFPGSHECHSHGQTKSLKELIKFDDEIRQPNYFKTKLLTHTNQFAERDVALENKSNDENKELQSCNETSIKTTVIKERKPVLLQATFIPSKRNDKIPVKTDSIQNIRETARQNELILRNYMRRTPIINKSNSVRNFQQKKMRNEESILDGRNNLKDIEIKAVNVKSENKNVMAADEIRDGVLAKFNNWEIDLDWDDGDLQETATTTHISSTNIESPMFGLDGKRQENLAAIENTITNRNSTGLVNNWKFKSNTTGDARRCGESGSDIMEVFLGLRNKSNPRRQPPVNTTDLPNKRRKINYEVTKVKKEAVSPNPIMSNMNQSKFAGINSYFCEESIVANEVTSPLEKDVKASQLIDSNLPMKIICSSDAAEDSELINLLELRYNLSFVMRSADVNNAEMCSVPDFIIDESTAVVVNSLSSLNDPQEFIKLRKKLFSLTLRHSLIWLLLVNRKILDPCVHPETLKMFSKLTILSQQLNCTLKDSIYKIFICKDIEQTTSYIRRIVDLSIQSNRQWDDSCNHNFTSRDWFLPKPTAHEAFLCKFPSINAFNAQIMLGSSTLRCLLQSSLQELNQILPIIPAKFLENFLKLAHRSLLESPTSTKNDLKDENTELQRKQVATTMPKIIRSDAISSVIPTIQQNLTKHEVVQFQEFQFNSSPIPISYQSNPFSSSTSNKTSDAVSYDGFYPYNDYCTNGLPPYSGFGHFRPIFNGNTYARQLPIPSSRAQRPQSYNNDFHYAFQLQRCPNIGTECGSGRIIPGFQMPHNHSDLHWHNAFNFKSHENFCNYINDT